MNFSKHINKNKGTTLIELLLVISISAIVMSSSFMGYKSFKTYSNNIDNKYYKNSIHNLINGAKQSCRTKKQVGRIYFFTNTNEIAFYLNLQQINKLEAPKGFDLLEVNTNYSNLIIIDKYGFTSDACTIKYKDRKGIVNKLTICVGTGYVDIKEE